MDPTRRARRRARATGTLAALLLAWPLAARAEGPTPKDHAKDPAKNPAKDPATKTDRAGLVLVLVPAGDFLQGTTEEQDKANRQLFWRSAPVDASDLELEQPRHPVRISKAFYLGAREVTVGQFRRFVAATGYVTDAEKSKAGGRGFNVDARNGDAKGQFETSRKYTWKNPGFPQGDDHPVVLVSWNDAQAYSAWRSREEKAVYRLPTEAEWEYACRAGTQTWLSFGDDPSLAYLYANLADGALEAAQPGHVMRQRLVDVAKEPRDGYAYTAPVGHFKPNAFGLYDMHGNVWEWCRDRFQRASYRQLDRKIVTVDPQGPADRDEYGDLRVLRGGSWYVGMVTARSSSRLWNAPSEAFCYAGFRVVREP
jgi:sulfatase modifying factor 1